MKNLYMEETGGHFIKTAFAVTPEGQNQTVISYGEQCFFAGCDLFTKNITTYQKMVRGDIAHHFHFYSLLLS